MIPFNDLYNSKQGIENVSPEIKMAEQKCNEAENAVNDAMLALGRQYYKANKDNAESEFAEQIAQITECTKKVTLWSQYRLTLEGKMKCESCNAIITSDSLFCNKCGTRVEAMDFSNLEIDTAPSEETVFAPVVDNNVCPACGAPLVSNALFCEQCGQKIG